MLPLRALFALCALISVQATASPLPNAQNERAALISERSPLNQIGGYKPLEVLHRSASPSGDEEGESTGNAAWISRPGGRPYKRQFEGEDTGSKEFFGGGGGRPYKRQDEGEDTGSEEFFGGGGGRPF